MSAQHSSLVLRQRSGASDRVYWDAQWRYRLSPEEPWRFKKQRLGLAWQESDGNGGWRKRKGRCPAGWLDVRAANVAAAEAMKLHVEELTTRAAETRAAREKPVTVRDVADDWLRWLKDVRGAKPSTLRDYAALLREPGSRFARREGESRGRIMAALGDRPISDVTTTELNRFLRAVAEEGLTPRNVNKHRQTLGSLFAYACRDDTYKLTRNPVSGTDSRRETPPAALDYYEVEEVEALARACEHGAQREPRKIPVRRDERAARAAEDVQDAELFRTLFYTGMRLGEALALRWGDVSLAARALTIRRALSAGVETLPKGRRVRMVPLPTPAVSALARLSVRPEFTSSDDYVFANRFGRCLDPSAARKRYHRACVAAGLRRVKLHGLRHAAGSLLARTADPVFVRDFLGHSKLATTDRYVSAKFRPEELERLDRAFAPAAMPVDAPRRERSRTT